MAGRLPYSAKADLMREKENNADAPPVNNNTEDGGRLDFSAFMEAFVSDLKGYVSAQKQFLVLHLSEKASRAMGKALEHTVIFAVLGMSLLFMNVALALYLGNLLSSAPLGFLIVAGFYLLLLSAFLLWWRNGARDRFILDRINDLNDDN
jgi:Putative Actinobacterial Holin-X, holin superfamily III